METKSTPSLDAAIMQAQVAIGSIRKGAHNSFAGYDYVDAESMVAASRDALLGAGVLVSVEHFRLRGQGKELVVHFRIAGHGESRTGCAVMPVIEGKGKPADKATATAYTMALREFLRGLLLVPRVDGAEPDERDDRGHVPAVRTPPPSQAKPVSVPKSDGKSTDEKRLAILADLTAAQLGDAAALRRAEYAIRLVPQDERGPFKGMYQAAKAAVADVKERVPGQEG